MKGKEFDVAVAKQRFEDYDADKSGKITLDEFIGKYLKEEEYYVQQISLLKKMIEEKNLQKEEFVGKYNEAKVFLLLGKNIGN